MSEQLPAKLREFNETLTEAEKANFKLILGLAAGGLAPTFSKPGGDRAGLAFDAVSDTLGRLQPYSGRIPPNGIAYRGRPALMTDELLGALQTEARAGRSAARRYEEHYLGCGAPLANNLAVSAELTSFVREHAGAVEPTGIASFLYYDEPGQGIEPHIDTEIFSLNVLLMLDHQYAAAPPSALVVFPPRREPERLILEPGEILILFAGSVAHGRERMRPRESVSILTFGFHPIA